MQSLEQAYNHAESIVLAQTGVPHVPLTPEANPDDARASFAIFAPARDDYLANDVAGKLRRSTFRRQQLAFEDQLGRELAGGPTALVVEFLGSPPAPSATPRVNLVDGRWWVQDEHLDVTLTPRQAWERAAGAVAGLAYGRGRVLDLDGPAEELLDWESPDDVAAGEAILSGKDRAVVAQEFEGRGTGYVELQHFHDVVDVLIPQIANGLGHAHGAGLR